MTTKQEVAQAKKAVDAAWDKAVEAGEEALAALKTAEDIQARDTSDAYVEKTKAAGVAHDAYRKASREAAAVLQAYYDQFWPK
jgi:hypothetical protein